MPTATPTNPPTQVFLDARTPKKTSRLTDAQPKQICSHCKLLFPSSVPHSATPSGQSTTNPDNPTIPRSTEAEDEYTLSAYGDLSLGEIIVPPLPAPTCPNPVVLQPRIPQPRLRLKVQRPPMPRHRLSYTYLPDPLPYTGRLESDEYWPGSPRLITDSVSWLKYQPLVSPLLADRMSPRSPGNKPEKNGSTLEKPDELLPRSSSIRSSPSDSPANQAPSLPQETSKRKNTDQEGQNLLEATDSPVKPPQIPLPSVPQRTKPWRSRLPPRPPIPKWDI